MPIEWLLLNSVLLVGILLFARNLRGLVRWSVACGILGLDLTGGLLWQKHLHARQTSLDTMIAKTPREGRMGYVTSDACLSCHPAQYESWHKSFHRTMTQHATPASVRGEFNGTQLFLDGDHYSFEQRGDEYWVEMIDPDWKYMHATGQDTASPSIPPRTWKRVNMLTGSHHMQAYWVPSAGGNLQYSLPFTYLFADHRWVPRNDVFLVKSNAPHIQQMWNATCINCHATAPHARQDENTKLFDTREAELGIACEACHGPAEEHLRYYADPVHRYVSHQPGKSGARIVNPAKLDHAKSSEVCSRCHAIRINPRPAEWNADGVHFQPGGEIEANAPLLRRMRLDLPDTPEARWLHAMIEGSFWPDGQVRVSGREYNGLHESKCFTRGDLSCISCHSMHRFADTDDQLAPKMDGNAACVQCHGKYASNIEQHTHHAANSAGSLCYNCHMPYTTYGLLKAIRSHTINSPSVVSSLKTGRPNACNLCHLDKSLGWAQANLGRWYGTKPVRLSDDEAQVPASLLWLLRGDAGQRALIAWHMGWPEAHKAAGRDWLPPYLAETLTDSYAVVRYIGQRSLKRFPGFEKLAYDYIGPEPGRAQARDEVRKKSPAPSLDAQKLARLLAERKDPAIELFE